MPDEEPNPQPATLRLCCQKQVMRIFGVEEGGGAGNFLEVVGEEGTAGNCLEVDEEEGESEVVVVLDVLRS